MALIPYAYRPSVIVRGKALRQGVFGPSKLWKAVAVVVFGRSTMKKMFGRNEELLDKAVLKGGGRLMQIETIKQPTRRQRRKTRKREATSAARNAA
jgi:hypothetical protein